MRFADVLKRFEKADWVTIAILIVGIALSAYFANWERLTYLFIWLVYAVMLATTRAVAEIRIDSIYRALSNHIKVCRDPRTEVIRNEDGWYYADFRTTNEE